MVRIAAVGDVHAQAGNIEMLKAGFLGINEKADVLAVAGDLTANGAVDEAHDLLRALAGVAIPVVLVLGNHDYHRNEQQEIKDMFRDTGQQVLDGEATKIDIGGTSVGFIGTKGFGGGFGMRALPDFGEDIFKMMYNEGLRESERIRRGLETVNADFKIVLLHYSPVKDTLFGEPPEVYAFLGASILAEPIDKLGADLVLHGHAHYGSEKGMTAGGVPVRNVAMPIMGRPYSIYYLNR